MIENKWFNNKEFTTFFTTKQIKTAKIVTKQNKINFKCFISYSFLVRNAQLLIIDQAWFIYPENINLGQRTRTTMVLIQAHPGHLGERAVKKSLCFKQAVSMHTYLLPI